MKRIYIGLNWISVLWLGMIIAIGMESIVKFNTPSLTKVVAFDLGRTVFFAFNNLQILLLSLVVLMGLFAKLDRHAKTVIACVAVILGIQIFGLFPSLSERVDLLMQGQTLAHSFIHPIYGILELLKIACLVYLSVLSWRKVCI